MLLNKRNSFYDSMNLQQSGKRLLNDNKNPHKEKLINIFDNRHNKRFCCVSNKTFLANVKLGNKKNSLKILNKQRLKRMCKKNKSYKLYDIFLNIQELNELKLNNLGDQCKAKNKSEYLSRSSCYPDEIKDIQLGSTDERLLKVINCFEENHSIIDIDLCSASKLNFSSYSDISPSNDIVPYKNYNCIFLPANYIKCIKNNLFRNVKIDNSMANKNTSKKKLENLQWRYLKRKNDCKNYKKAALATSLAYVQGKPYQMRHFNLNNDPVVEINKEIITNNSFMEANKVLFNEIELVKEENVSFYSINNDEISRNNNNDNNKTHTNTKTLAEVLLNNSLISNKSKINEEDREDKDDKESNDLIKHKYDQYCQNQKKNICKFFNDEVIKNFTLENPGSESKLFYKII